MSLTGIIILLLIAFLLIFLEVFVMPGVGFAGILGLLFLVAGVYLGYTRIGTPIAHYITAIVVGVSLLILIVGLRADVWKKVSLNTAVDSKVETHTSTIAKGDQGIAITRLGPVGKAEFNGETIEVRTTGNIVDAKTVVEIIKIDRNEIIVKPLK